MSKRKIIIIAMEVIGGAIVVDNVRACDCSKNSIISLTKLVGGALVGNYIGYKTANYICDYIVLKEKERTKNGK